MAKLEVLLTGLKFGEAPRWHDGKLWFSDFYAHRIMTVDLQGRSEVVAEVAQQPSGLGWTPEGKLLVVSMLDHRLLEIVGTQQRVVADLSEFAGGPCNDMVVDTKGRAYVGNFGFDRHKGEAERSTCIVRVDPDGRMTRAADDLLFPNGTVITPDGKTLIVGETFASRLTAFDIAADGALGNRRLFAAIDAWPDGICLDAEGAVWVTNPRGHEVLRVFEGGRIAERVSTGERFAYACMIGGADRRTLCVITNTGSGPAMGAKSDGRIETVHVDVPGAGLP